MSQLRLQDFKIKAQTQKMTPEVTVYYYETLAPTLFSYTLRDWGLQPAPCQCGFVARFCSFCPPCRYTLEQQIIAPQFSMQQVNCNAVLVPSPVFTSPIMIPHNSFMANQSQSVYHTQPQASQHSLQLQQPQQFFQVQRLPVQ